MDMKQRESLSSCSVDLLQDGELQEDSPRFDINIDDFCQQFESICNSHNVYEVMKCFIDQIKKHKKNELLRKDCPVKTFWLAEEYENMLFQTLLGKVQNKNVFKYSNVQAILYAAKNEQAMTSVIGMNDATETKYADVYLRNKGYETHVDDSVNVLIGSRVFITSFTYKKDDLTMWRLYGDDAKGVTFEYGFDYEDIKDNFFFAPVSYADKKDNHKELDFVADLRNISIEGCRFLLKNLYIWKYFFKPKEYSDEDEVRLLYFSSNHQEKFDWIKTGTGMIAPMKKFAIIDRNNDFDKKQTDVYPLTLKGIWMGPRMPEWEENIKNIHQLTKEVFGWTVKDKKIKPSAIENYRESKN